MYPGAVEEDMVHCLIPHTTFPTELVNSPLDLVEPVFELLMVA